MDKKKLGFIFVGLYLVSLVLVFVIKGKSDAGEGKKELAVKQEQESVSDSNQKIYEQESTVIETEKIETEEVETTSEEISEKEQSLFSTNLLKGSKPEYCLSIKSNMGDVTNAYLMPHSDTPIDNEMIYVLNGDYSILKCTLFVGSESINSKAEAYIEFKDENGNLIAKTPVLDSISDPIDIEVPVQDVKKLSVYPCYTRGLAWQFYLYAEECILEK